MDLLTPLMTSDWRPPTSLPDLARYDVLWFDYESTGKDPQVDTPTGMAICTPDDKAWYLPTGHRGGNLDPSLVKAWAASRSGLRGKTLVGSWIKIDAHFSRNWGLPFDALDVELRDVQHQACLLNEHRRKSGLDLLASELLIDQRKLTLPFNLETTRMSEVHASLVGPYAIQDVRLTKAVDLAQRPLITAEGLDVVLALEDSIILAIVEMEANGAPLDLDLLEQWRGEVRRDHWSCLSQLRDAAGFKVNPDSVPDMKQLFGKLGLPTPLAWDDKTRRMKPSFSREALLSVEHPLMPLVLKTKSRASLLSKYLDKYAKCHRNGILYYNLHQLRADDSGTITGRFSAAAVDKDEDYGANPQQVFHPKKQAIKIGTSQWPVRRLFVHGGHPRFRSRWPSSRVWVSADAKQIEYRIFAHLANNPTIIQAFRDDPDVDYHSVVMEMIRLMTGVEMIRDLVKNVNFAKIYGAMVAKIARMLGVTVEEAERFLRAYAKSFPEVEPLIKSVEDTIWRRARQSDDHVGFVLTMAGRRRRYPMVDGRIDRAYSGLNAHIQGTAADIMKMKLRDVYRERKLLEFTMRMTVHDAVEGDLNNPDKAFLLRDLLDQQAMPLRVPIRWDVEVGENWAHLTKIDHLRKAA